MNYRNTEMKLDALVSYFNEEKINLSPAFQRGHVWGLQTRRRLIANIVQGRPIPAIFLYKEASGSRYFYNILDGKQRLETIILFVGSKRADFGVRTWSKYFFGKVRRDVDFAVVLPNGSKTFTELDEETVRDFREYSIPTVEINLTDGSHLDEIISLFVDINQQGVRVGRFDIVKAMGANNQLLHSVFGLIAIKQTRNQDTIYKGKRNDYTLVLRHINAISNLTDAGAQVDRMWQFLLEIVLFQQSQKHRKPADILKSFISGAHDQNQRFPKLSKHDLRAIKSLFRWFASAYDESQLSDTSLSTDQTRFYTTITTLMSTDLMTRFTRKELLARLVKVGRILDFDEAQPKGRKFEAAMIEFLDLAQDRTTDGPRREQRQKRLVEMVDLVIV